MSEHVVRRSPESLERAYKHHERRGTFAASNEPLPEDVVAHEAKKNPWAWGIWASIRFTGFLKMLNKQNTTVTVLQLLFALELTYLNWFNADGLPVSAEEIQKARKAARDYYVRGIKGE